MAESSFITKEDYDKNLESLLKYTGNYSNVELAMLQYAGEVAQVQEALGDAPDLSSIATSAPVSKIAKEIMSLTPRNEYQGLTGRYTKEIVDSLVALMSNAETTKSTGEELRNAIRITMLHPYSGDKDKLKYLMNGSTTHFKEGEPSFYDLVNSVPMKCHSTPRFMKADSISGIPSIGTGVSCSVIEILKPGFGPTSRDTKEVAAFTSIATSLELSRCIPYFKMDVVPPKFVFGDDEEDKEKKGSTIETPPYFNIIGFLKGDKKEVLTNLKSLKYGADEGISLSTGFDSTKPDGKNAVRLSMGGGGMELFTTPQTMMTERSNLQNFTTPVLDRTRPFMTVTNAKITTNIACGWNVYKSATLEIVLHDRSRMNLIAPLLRPEIFAGTDKTTFYLEYGWSHPDGKKTTSGRGFVNPIGAFLNSMRVREAYEAYNVSYNFADSGQVNISLQLVSKSQVGLFALDTSITEVQESVRIVEELVKKINKQFNDIESSGTDTSTLKTAFPEVIMGGIGSADAALSMNLEKYEEIKKNVDLLAKSPSEAGKVGVEIQRLLQTVKQAQESSSAQGVKKLENLYQSQEIFPISFTSSGSPSSSVTIPPGNPGAKDSLSVSKPCVSLGKVLYAFIAAPLASTGQFAEVQLIFHTHNRRASFMRSVSIARHPLDYEILKKDVTDFLKQKPKMSIGDFITMLNEKHIGNDSSFAYGFSKFMPKSDKDKVDSTILEKQSKVINAAGIKDGVYMKPSISLYSECVMGSNSQPILRIHVTDSRSITHASYVDMLRSARDTADKIFSSVDINPDHPMSTNIPEAKSVGSDIAKLNKYLTDKGVLKPALAESKAPTAKTDENKTPIDQKNSITDAKSLKRLVSKGMPTIRYGQGAGAINSIGVSSLSDPALTTVALTAGGQSSALDPANADQLRGIPMRITPAEMSVEMIGCPLLNPMQSFFVDLDTMTSLDGIYTISTVDHTLSPGTFTTSSKLLNTGDSYATFRSAGTDMSNALSRWMQEDAQKKLIEEEKRQQQLQEDRVREQKAARDIAIQHQKDEQAKRQTLSDAEKAAIEDYNKVLDTLWKKFINSINGRSRNAEQNADCQPFRVSVEDAMGREKVIDLSEAYYKSGTGLFVGVHEATDRILLLAAKYVDEARASYSTSGESRNILSSITAAISNVQGLPLNTGRSELQSSFSKNLSSVKLSAQEAALSEFQSAISDKDNAIKKVVDELQKKLEKKSPS
jgi:hypothetical protein